MEFESQVPIWKIYLTSSQIAFITFEKNKSEAIPNIASNRFRIDGLWSIPWKMESEANKTWLKKF